MVTDLKGGLKQKNARSGLHRWRLPQLQAGAIPVRVGKRAAGQLGTIRLTAFPQEIKS